MSSNTYKTFNSNDKTSFTPLRVLGVGSSMRKESFGTETLRIVLGKVKENGAETRLLNLFETPLPIYSSSLNSDNRLIRQVSDLVNWADAFILSTPDYHGSMSGSLKNFLDYFWSEFAGKTFGYICSSHEKGLTVMDQIRTAIRQCYGWSLPYGLSINSGIDFDDQRKIVNKQLIGRINSFARDLVVYGKLINTQFRNDLNSKVENSFAYHYRK
ncbi:MAG TPA: NAD(P)H-dependent oxidoreductase [Nitrososphaeraceae archaeon]|nr:NAD(P)H-dependent oxidoreductase [Nitrososphaeraceae archaeon]